MTANDTSRQDKHALGEPEPRPIPTYNSLAEILALATTAVERMTPDD